MVIMRDGFFYPVLTKIMDSFSYIPLNTAVFFLKKGSQKLLNRLGCDIQYNDVILTCQ